ncbi:MAG: nitrite/sulfite reductase [Acidobacteriota bacterium]|nr:nitrite/sulfite reductase [Acidobacteriota bacterium]
MTKAFTPNFKTPLDQHNGAELGKRNSNGMRGHLHGDFRGDQDNIAAETENLAKSYGIYLEFNRAKTGREKDWIYMIRLGIPGGGPVSPEQWRLLDELAEAHSVNPEGFPSLRLTTRQAIQFHWVRKPGVLDIVKRSAEAGLLSLNGCGDNVRNVMACPNSEDSQQLSRDLAAYFQLPQEPFIQIFAIDPTALEQEPTEKFQYGPQLLNRKFKIAVSAVHRNPITGELERDNCVEVRTHDLGIVPVIADNEISGYQLFVGGGQGEKYGKPTASMLSKPFAYTTREDLLPTIDALVAVHQEWGDRQNRHWARLKYVVQAKGIDWLREQTAERLGRPLEQPVHDLDPGPRRLHHGWEARPDGTFNYGAFIENGRLIDNSSNGRLKSMVRQLSAKYNSSLRLTANQDILFTGIAEELREAFAADLEHFGFGVRNGEPYSTLRLHSGACVGKDTCRLAYTDSEKFEPELIDQLEEMGWGYLAASIGITGCERQCFRPGTKTIGLVGSGRDRYQVKLFGTEDARHQGVPLTDGDEVYLRSVPRNLVAGLLDTVFRYYEVHRGEMETLGYFIRRVGKRELIDFLKVHPRTAGLMEKTNKDFALQVS